MDRLRNEKHQSMTRKNYYTIWKLFNKFILKLDKKPTTWEDRLSLFVGYLVNNRNKSTMIRSYVSAIKSVLADVDVKITEDSYLLVSLTRACKLINNKIHIRLPIYRDMLHIIVTDVQHHMAMKGQIYLSILYPAIFSASYYGLLRVSEVAAKTHPILVHDSHIATNKKKILFILRTSKTHSKSSRPQEVKITSSTNNSNVNPHLCPSISCKITSRFANQQNQEVKHFLRTMTDHLFQQLQFK